METSCDETAVSIVEGRGDFSHTQTRFSCLSDVRVLSHVVESQTSHKPFGGVVPEVAARDHLAKIDEIARQALAQSGLKISDIDGVAVTYGPGLIGALMVGVLYAQGVAVGLGKPLFGVNHVDAHLAPALLLSSFNPAADVGCWLKTPSLEFPSLALTVSGGHCILSELRSPVDRSILGTTLDDACGEAFDKVAKLLGFDYPGGPEVEVRAKKVGKSRYKFASTLQDKSLPTHFSFSGLKTAVLEVVRKETGTFRGKISGASLSDEIKNELCYAFQEAAVGQLADRMQNALSERPYIKRIFVAGGVAANARFRERFEQFGIPLHFAPLKLCSDNATMIALDALLRLNRGEDAKPFPRYQEGLKL